MSPERLKLIQQDPWLEPSEQDVIDRHNRYLHRKKELENSFGSLSVCADGYTYFGITLSEDKTAIVYREWAPQADALFMAGDFNSWHERSHPMKKDGEDMWRKFVFLAPGMYEYKYLIDGKWCMDSENPLTCPNTFGSRNNFIVISE